MPLLLAQRVAWCGETVLKRSSSFLEQHVVVWSMLNSACWLSCCVGSWRELKWGHRADECRGVGGVLSLTLSPC